MKISRRLQALRESAGMSQSGLSSASGVPIGTIRNIEQGNRQPTFPVLRKLSIGLGVSLGAWDGLDDDPVKKRGRKR